MVFSLRLRSSHLWGRSHYHPQAHDSALRSCGQGATRTPQDGTPQCPSFLCPWLVGLGLGPHVGSSDPAGTPSQPWPGGHHLRPQDWGLRELRRAGTGLQMTHPQADNTRVGVGKSSSTHRGDPHFAHVLPKPSCPGSSSTGVAASQWPHEGSRAGHPVSDASHGWQIPLRGDREGRGGQGAGSWGSAARMPWDREGWLQGHCRPGLGGSRGAGWASSQVLARPLSHPPQPSLDARYGSQAAQACLGPVARGNLRPHFLLHRLRETPGGQTFGHPHKKQGEEKRATGAWGSRPSPAGAPSQSLLPRLSPSASPAHRVPHGWATSGQEGKEGRGDQGL